jgi:ADP-ribose pyrophosphatase YjhB (NUDIX family)
LGETALEAVKREVAEETSLAVLEVEPMGVYSGPSQIFTYLNGEQVHCFSIAFIVRRWQGEPRADGVEGSELRFFDRRRLPDELVPIHRTTIEDFGNYRGEFLLH